jgi:hypothetical protein
VCEGVVAGRADVVFVADMVMGVSGLEVAMLALTIWVTVKLRYEKAVVVACGRVKFCVDAAGVTLMTLVTVLAAKVDVDVTVVAGRVTVAIILAYEVVVAAVHSMELTVVVIDVYTTDGTTVVAWGKVWVKYCVPGGSVVVACGREIEVVCWGRVTCSTELTVVVPWGRVTAGGVAVACGRVTETYCVETGCVTRTMLVTVLR